MKKVSLFFCILFYVSNLWGQIIINKDNYKHFIGKNLFFCNFDKKYNPKYSINNKVFNYKKYKEKEVKILDIDSNLNITLLDINRKKIQIRPIDNKILLHNIGISDDLDIAKKFFIGKYIKSNDKLDAKIHDEKRNSFGFSPELETIYRITDVTWEESTVYFEETPYRLILDTNQYIRCSNENKFPEYFVETSQDGISQSLYKISKKFDKLEKTTTINLENSLYIEKDEKNLYKISNIYFDVYQISENKYKKTHYVSLMYCANDWLFIEKCYIYIDGQKDELNIGNSDRDVRTLIFETFHFPIGKNLLEKIIKAKEVVIRLIGSDGTVNAYFSAQNIYNIKRFYMEYIK